MNSLLFTGFLCVLAVGNGAAAAPASDNSVATNVTLMDETIRNLRQNLTDVWNAMAVLSERLELLEEEADEGSSGGGSWQCDDEEGGDIHISNSNGTTTWKSVLENVTNPLTSLIDKITGHERDAAAGRRKQDNHKDHKEKDGGEDDDDDEAKEEHEDNDDSGENKVKADDSGHRQPEQPSGRKCSWRRGNRRSKLSNNQEERKRNITGLCSLRPNKALPPELRPDVRGQITLTQKGTNKLVITVKLSGLPPPAKQEQRRRRDLKPGFHNHGFHAHEFGNLTNGCESAGGHFNPLRFNHSGPTSPKRHLGDFGNLVSDERGIVDTVLEIDIDHALTGNNSLIGRAIVIHELEDDLGSNSSNPVSMQTGNSGSRLACCVVRKECASFVGPSDDSQKLYANIVIE